MAAFHSTLASVCPLALRAAGEDRGHSAEPLRRRSDAHQRSASNEAFGATPRSPSLPCPGEAPRHGFRAVTAHGEEKTIQAEAAHRSPKHVRCSGRAPRALRSSLHPLPSKRRPGFRFGPKGHAERERPALIPRSGTPRRTKTASGRREHPDRQDGHITFFMRTRSAGKARPSKRRQSHKKVLCTPVAEDARPTRSPGTRHGQGAYAGSFSSRGGNSLARTGSRRKTKRRTAAARCASHAAYGTAKINQPRPRGRDIEAEERCAARCGSLCGSVTHSAEAVSCVTRWRHHRKPPHPAPQHSGATG